MNSIRQIFLSVLVVALLLPGTSMVAQETSGQLIGVLTDPTGAVIPSATVTATHKDTGRILTTTTNSAGEFTLRNVDPGRYKVRFEKTGFTSFEVADATLLVGRTLRVNGNMALATVETNVTIVAETPVVDFSNTVVGHNVTAEEFDKLPKGRSFQGLLTTSPSVNSGQDQFGNIVGIEGGLQVNGASSAENQFYIDGVSTNSQLHGHSRQNSPFEFLQEIQVKTGGTPAEYGGALGGVMTAVTKAGGNDFHGEVHYYFTGEALAAGPVKRLLNPLTVSVDGYSTIGSNGYIQDGEQRDRRYEAGGSLGGRIVKDKAWFFVSASPQWRRRSVFYNLTDGTDTVKVKRVDRQAFAKVSFNPTNSIRTNFNVLWTPTVSTGNPLAYNAEANTRRITMASNEINKRVGFFQPQTNYSGNIDINLNPQMVLTLKGGRFWDNYKSSGIPNITAVEYQTPTSNLSPELLATVPPDLIGGLNFSNTPRLRFVDHDLVTRTFFNADYSVIGNLAGTHDVKLGWGITKNVNNVDDSYPNGGYIFVQWGQSFTSLVAGAPCNVSPCRGTYGYYELNDIGTKGSTGGTIQSIYAQDRWRIHRRVTLDLGLRAENEKVPSFRRSVLDPAFEFGFKDKIMPRLGVAVDVLGDGKLKAAFSWGRYYDWVKYELSRGVFGGDIWITKYRALDSASDVFSLSAQNLPGRDLWDDRVPGSFRDRRIPSFSSDCSATNLSTCQVDPALKPTGTDLINASVEYQLGPRTVLRAGYVRNSLIRAIEDMGVLIEGSENYLYVNPGEGLLGKVMNITPGTATRAPASLCQSKLSGQNLEDCLAGIVFPTPRPVRTYNALEISITRRFANGWFLDGSYVFSRLFGNYPGIANADEIRTPTVGSGYGPGQQQSSQITRQGGSATRAWDLDQIVFDSRGNLGPRGRLPTDRPHVFKLYGAYTFRFGTELGAYFNASSGTPITTYAYTTDQIPMMVNRRGDLGRTPFFTQTDLNIAHSFNIAEGKKLKLEFNMINVFNQKTARHVYNCINYDCINGQVASGMKMTDVDLFQGFDYNALIAASSNGERAFDPRYTKEDLFNPGFVGRFGVKFSF